MTKLTMTRSLAVAGSFKEGGVNTKVVVKEPDRTSPSRRSGLV
jgi:hypothetical protein